MKYLLDTCVISDFFKHHPATIKNLKRASPQDLSISAITVMEIEYGLAKTPSREETIRPAWNALLNEIYVFPFDDNEARCTGFLRAHLKSKTIGAYDFMIAGTALAQNLCIVTSNMDEFSRLEDLIAVENWRTLP